MFFRVNWDILESDEPIILPNGAFLELVQKEGGLQSIKTSVYRSRDSTDGHFIEASFTYRNGSLYGKVEDMDTSHLVETMPGHPENVIIWELIDDSVWANQSTDIDLNRLVLPKPIFEKQKWNQLLEKGITDKSTVAEYSVTVYYTAGFKASTPDPYAFIEQVIAETNAGYANSGVNLRVKLHCVLPSSIPDGQVHKDTLVQFTNSQESVWGVRWSGDVAILLVDRFMNDVMCGGNWMDALADGYTLGVILKDCALGYYSFGHEIAHGFGLAHDRRVARFSSTKYAYGNIIKKRKYRTIMAYNYMGEKRLNLYSSSTNLYRGLPTGSRKADNARRLNEIRFLAANIGDESSACPFNTDLEPTKTTTTFTASSSITPLTNVSSNTSLGTTPLTLSPSGLTSLSATSASTTITETTEPSEPEEPTSEYASESSLITIDVVEIEECTNTESTIGKEASSEHTSEENHKNLSSPWIKDNSSNLFLEETTAQAFEPSTEVMSTKSTLKPSSDVTYHPSTASTASSLSSSTEAWSSTSYSTEGVNSSLSAPVESSLALEKICEDIYKNCKMLYPYCWSKSIANVCLKTCGQCPGQKPAASVNCFDRLPNCDAMVHRCMEPVIKKTCMVTCKACQI